ncbi:MAG: PAS domain S-box protein [Deltaproteobacteria bacterium]|nr:PAS domain S-box protein [Deltaproteobacteria bacterium]
MSCIPSLFIGALLCLLAAPATRAETPLPVVRKEIAAVPADIHPANFKNPTTGKPSVFWTTQKVAGTVAVTLLFSGLVMGCWRHATVLRLNRELRQTLGDLERSRQELVRSEERSRRLAREAEQERARGQAILEGIQDGISIQDREYRILYQNPYFIKMVGAHQGKFCYRAYHQQNAVCKDCPVEMTFRDTTPKTAVRMFKRPNGPLYVEIHCSPLRDEQGEVFAVIESIRDITERKRMEEALHEQTARLEQEIAERQQAQEALAVKQLQLEEINDALASGINEAVSELRRKDQMLIQQNRLAAMGEMINNIAHQWRQPLNNIGLIVQNLHLSYESGEMTIGEMNREVGKAMDVIMHMSRTIDDFRNFFRPDKQKCGFVVNKVVADSLDFVAASIESSNIRVEVTADTEVGAFGYPNEYAQVLLNILSNAREALIEKAVAKRLISIRVTSENNRSVVAIRDNGGGIPEGFLPKIFDPYFTTKEPGKGTGIGLYMSKVIIEQHMGGRLSARNVERGAEFRIEL